MADALTREPDVDRAEWLAWRREGLGASDIAAILGISRWASPWSVWADKVGLLPLDDEDNATDAMTAGRWLERAIGPWFEHRTGLHVAGEQMQCSHREHGHHRCTLDGIVGDGPNVSIDGALGGLEMKHEAFGKRWDEVPPHYEAQALWQIHVTGLERVFFAVLRGRTLDTDHVVERDDAEIAFIVERAEAFWRDHVLAGVPPAVDGSDATLAAIAQVWPEHTPGDAVELTSAAAEALDLLAEAKAAKKEAETAEKTAKAVIATALGDAEEGLVDGQRAVTYRAQVRTHTCPHCGVTDTSDPFRVLRPVKSKETNR